MLPNAVKTERRDSTVKYAEDPCLDEAGLDEAGPPLDDEDDIAGDAAQEPRTDAGDYLRGPFDFVFAVVASVILWILLLFIVVQLLG